VSRQKGHASDATEAGSIEIVNCLHREFNHRTYDSNTLVAFLALPWCLKNPSKHFEDRSITNKDG
jgi:hypothetical protein